MENDIKIDAGLVHLTINGGPAFIEFNANDVLFAERFYDLMKVFGDKQKEYQTRSKEIAANNKLDENGIPANMGEGLKLVHEICEFMRERVDILFGEGTSQKVFGNAYVLEMFEQFFSGVLPFIQKSRDEKLRQYAPPANGEKRVKRNRHHKTMK